MHRTKKVQVKNLDVVRVVFTEVKRVHRIIFTLYIKY